jgi:UDP-N-acetylglucosamine--N-acetylmuramyl-(pentapeptide) pyrophosphoryl-undecaprenol N-acetylglucosamine transferase
VIAASPTPYPTLTADGPVRLLVYGGSQGARFFSDVIGPTLKELPAATRQRLRLVQQARQEDVEQVSEDLKAVGVEADIAPFFKNLPELMASSHLVIARAGASSVAELAVIGRPSILVPLPHSLDSDQFENASSLAESGGSWCIEQRDLTPLRLAAEIGRLVASPETLVDAAAKAKAQGQAQSVTLLADLVEELIGQSAA